MTLFNLKTCSQFSIFLQTCKSFSWILFSSHCMLVVWVQTTSRHLLYEELVNTSLPHAALVHVRRHKRCGGTLSGHIVVRSISSRAKNIATQRINISSLFHEGIKAQRKRQFSLPSLFPTTVAVRETHSDWCSAYSTARI